MNAEVAIGVGVAAVLGWLMFGEHHTASTTSTTSSTGQPTPASPCLSGKCSCNGKIYTRNADGSWDMRPDCTGLAGGGACPDWVVRLAPGQQPPC